MGGDTEKQRQVNEQVSFVLRLWLEPGTSGERRWRGHIQHVQSGRDVYFQDLRRMLAFVEEISGESFPCECPPGSAQTQSPQGRSDRGCEPDDERT